MLLSPPPRRRLLVAMTILVILAPLFVNLAQSPPPGLGQALTRYQVFLPPGNNEPLDGSSLVINEVMPVGSDAQPAWVELLNVKQGYVSLNGAMLVSGGGASYRFPANPNGLPPGGLAVIVFGDGVDETDISDGVVTLYAGAGTPFAASGDQISLYRSGNPVAADLVDFFAWGKDPAGKEAQAAEVNLWGAGLYARQANGGLVSDTATAGESIGLLPSATPGLTDSYWVYGATRTTKGQPNGAPTPGVFLPADGTVVLARYFSLAWYEVPGAAQYHVQVARDQAFSQPVIDTVVDSTSYRPTTPPADGDYFWRVQGISGAGRALPFSDPVSITIESVSDLIVDIAESPNPRIRGPRAVQGDDVRGNWRIITVDIGPNLQRKDTTMICWDGDDEIGGRRPWDAGHSDGPGRHSEHGRNYCARASMAAINGFYGGTLSQDRISFEFYGTGYNPGGAYDGWPVGDLGHDVPLPLIGVVPLLSWTLNGAPIDAILRKPTVNEIAGWMIQGKPVFAGVPGHAVVLRGIALWVGPPVFGQIPPPWIMINDPWDASVKVYRYDRAPLIAAWPARGNPNGRQQEQSVSLDSDFDGIVDFDESIRFRTNPTLGDTDKDCIADKTDMHSYIYRRHNVYRRPGGAFEFGWDKALRKDLDTGGAIDGDEDVNYNGHLDSGETSAFDRADDRNYKGGCETTPTPTPSKTPTPKPSSTPGGTMTPTITATGVPTGTRTASPVPTGSITASPSPTGTLTVSPTVDPKASPTPDPKGTETPHPTGSPAPTGSPVVSVTATKLETAIAKVP